MSKPTEFASGEGLERPYVLINGRRILTCGLIRVGALGTGDCRDLATVELTLLCRSLLVDDEPALPA
jgi:hypothetical protein